MNDENYKGKNCIIFGANSFIGKTIGKFLGQNNVNLGLIDLKDYANREILNSFNKDNKVIYKMVESGNKDEIDEIIKEIYKNFGKIHYLICSFYICDIRNKIKPEDLSLQIWDNLFQEWIINYFLIMKAVVPLMIKAKGGRILFINTLTGYTGEGEGEGQIIVDGSIHESACSSGITGMLTSIAADIIPQGISVNGIALGTNYKNDAERILWAVNLWLSGIGDYSCGQILRLY
jgi:NAD(P)-dependent dehydrogenase (short-subunit alcohol dehydrogenase family)